MTRSHFRSSQIALSWRSMATVLHVFISLPVETNLTSTLSVSEEHPAMVRVILGLARKRTLC